MIVTNAEEEDPNKSLDSGYCEAVSSYEPNILFEVHGHGGTKACFDLEVSAGSSTRAVHAATLADALSEQMIHYPVLGDLTVSADFDAIHYKARYTATMQTERWLGIHVEFPLRVRKRGNRRGLPAEYIPGPIFPGGRIPRCRQARISSSRAGRSSDRPH